jgi:hypothetical protein
MNCQLMKNLLFIIEVGKQERSVIEIKILKIINKIRIALQNKCF